MDGATATNFSFTVSAIRVRRFPRCDVITYLGGGAAAGENAVILYSVLEGQKLADADLLQVLF